MILAVGIDVVEVSRIEEAMANPGFVERILNEAERTIPMSPQRLAGRWAAKEALAKCVPSLKKWHDATISNDPAGAPFVSLAEGHLTPGTYKIHLSISHERGVASAVVVLEEVGPP